MKNVLILLVLLTSLGSTAKASFWYKDLEFLAMENFSVDRKDGHVYVGFDYVINNPNWYGIKIKPSSLFLKIAGVDCGWVRVSDDIKIKAKTEKGYPFLLKGDASDFVKGAFTSLWTLLTGQGIDFNISGELKAGVGFFVKKWPTDYTYNMTFEEFLSFF